MHQAALSPTGAKECNTIVNLSDQAVESLGKQIAKKCVFIIRGCLREEEWFDAEQEFALIVSEVLRALVSN